MHANNPRAAFTLAEVLIALTIIGVVSALTIPALVQKTNKQEYVSALQKAYSTLSQATQQIIAENGSPKADENGETWMSNVEELYKMYKKYLINTKDCGLSDGCFAQGNYKLLNSNDKWRTYDIWNYPKLLLADGTSVTFVVVSKLCNYEAEGTKDRCADIYVDVNGSRKPNRFGRDTFYFALKENGLYPQGCDKDPADNNWACVKSDGTLGQGWGCACKVLREGKMDY